MVNISENGIITLSAGDYFNYPLFINAGDEINPLRYSLQGEDKLYFAIVEPNTPFECGIVRKIFTKEDNNLFGDVKIVLDGRDTMNVLPGHYYYEVKLCIRRDNKDYVNTVVERRKFNIV